MGGRGDRRTVLWVLFRWDEGGDKILKNLFRLMEERVRVLSRLVTGKQEEFLTKRLGWRGHGKFVHNARSRVAHRSVELPGGEWEFIWLLGGLMWGEAKASNNRWNELPWYWPHDLKSRSRDCQLFPLIDHDGFSESFALKKRLFDEISFWKSGNR
jgi:hypothetical protein